MNSQLDRLTSLVGDLLDVSRVETGKLQLKKEKFEIDSLIEDTIEDLKHSTHHQLIFKAKSHKTIYADKYRISQVLINLISNAIKDSPKVVMALVSTSAGQ